MANSIEGVYVHEYGKDPLFKRSELTKILPRNLKEVGSTDDACQKDNLVRVASKNGDVYIAAGASLLFELAAMVTEFHWYCGGTRERAANGQAFNWIQCDRAGNGAIHWTFFA